MVAQSQRLSLQQIPIGQPALQNPSQLQQAGRNPEMYGADPSFREYLAIIQHPKACIPLPHSDRLNDFLSIKPPFCHSNGIDLIHEKMIRNPRIWQNQNLFMHWIQSIVFTYHFPEGRIMKKCRMSYTLLALALLAAMCGVQGQQYSSGYQATMPSAGAAVGSASQYTQATMPGVGATTGSFSQYGQFYSTPLTPPTNHITAPTQIDIGGMNPLNVMLGTQGQTIPYGQFQSNPANAGNSYLWIKGSTEWTQYAVVPQGSTVQLIAIPPTAGNGILYFVDSDGQLYQDNYYFFPYGQMTFFADKPGRHILYFILNGKVSNTVIIDVTGTYTPPSNYMPPRYYPNYYPYYDSGYFPGFFSSVSFGESGGDHGGESGGDHSGESGGESEGDHGGEGGKEK